jgi:hypothetical protein
MQASHMNNFLVQEQPHMGNGSSRLYIKKALQQALQGFMIILLEAFTKLLL